MKMQELLWLGLRTLAGVLAMIVSFNGAISALGLDFHADTVLTVLYFALPTACIFVYIFVRTPRREALVQTVLALGYFSVYVMLNWRTCSAIGYCISPLATLWDTLRIETVEAALGVALLGWIAPYFDTKSRQETAQR